MQQPDVIERALAAEARRNAQRVDQGEMERVKEELAALEGKEKAAVKAQTAGIQTGMNPDAYASLFAEMAAERKALESRREHLEAQAVRVQPESPRTAAERLAAVLADLEEIFDA